jgi:hypothetical protein
MAETHLRSSRPTHDHRHSVGIAQCRSHSGSSEHVQCTHTTARATTLGSAINVSTAPQRPGVRTACGLNAARPSRVCCAHQTDSVAQWSFCTALTGGPQGNGRGPRHRRKVWGPLQEGLVPDGASLRTLALPARAMSQGPAPGAISLSWTRGRSPCPP